MSSFPIRRDYKIFLMIFLATTLQYFTFVSAGICWYKMDTHGYCKETLKYRTTKDKCCNDGSLSTAWSPDDLRDDVLFLWRTLNRGVPCKACKENCDGVRCGKNRKCIMRQGKPSCVCSPKCKYLNYKKGPVCGTDNRTYKSVCRLKKQRCKTKNPFLRVNYNGFCQSSCKTVKCKRGKYCVHDQYQNTHCIECSTLCARPGTSKVPICGDDGVTYQGSCHLETASCYSGKSISVAYRDACKPNATCENIVCPVGEKCIKNKKTNQPKCLPCSNCLEEIKDTELICGSNNQTYKSWCSMVQDSCKKGFFIEKMFTGSCELRNTLDYSVMRKYW